MKKRLFIFAGYDANGIIDDALIYYIEHLRKFGDIVLYMDCDCPKSEINKIKKYCLYAGASRHGEYDFGSYKRAYIWARDNKLLKNYDFVYLVNDSVFGPTMDMQDIIKKMESTKSDATGLIVSKHRTRAYMESWFIRLNKKIFTSDWFDSFISSVLHETRKSIITIKYENGLSCLINSNKCSWDGLYTVWGRYTYNHPKNLFKCGCPFIKRASFTRHNGSIGAQVKYVITHANPNATIAILKTANRIYGKEYMDWFLTYNPFKIFTRKLKYAKHKIIKGRI